MLSSNPTLLSSKIKVNRNLKKRSLALGKRNDAAENNVPASQRKSIAA
jgi:hypothetical protein